MNGSSRWCVNCLGQYRRKTYKIVQRHFMSSFIDYRTLFACFFALKSLKCNKNHVFVDKHKSYLPLQRTMDESMYMLPYYYI